MKASALFWSVVACGALAAAGCSGGSSGATATGTTEQAAALTSTTTAPPTTTTGAPTTTTTTAPLGPTAPLTGIEVASVPQRPALVVKIDNHSQARPQVGINQADVVFEEIVEANITRLAVVFHSVDADPVGPVRSARTTDLHLLTNLHRPLFANSGANTGTLSRIAQIDIQHVNVDTGGAGSFYFRDGPRPAPHDLFTNTSDLFGLAGDITDERLPPALFHYRRGEESLPAVASPVAEVTIDYGDRTAVYSWDAAAVGWARTQDGTPHVDADDVQVMPTNVVIQFTIYGRSPADPSSPEAILVGEGDVWILTDGHLIEGRWSRATAADVTTYTTADGEVIGLLPGRTWVALPKPGQVVVS